MPSVKDTITISKFLEDKIEATGRKTGTVRYLADWSDEKVAEALQLALADVEQVRRDGFGHLQRMGGGGVVANLAGVIDSLREEIRRDRAQSIEAIQGIQKSLEIMNQRLTDLEDTKTAPAPTTYYNGAEQKPII